MLTKLDVEGGLGVSVRTYERGGALCSSSTMDFAASAKQAANGLPGLRKVQIAMRDGKVGVERCDLLA